jgi:hypothetical protein
MLLQDLFPGFQVMQVKFVIRIEEEEVMNFQRAIDIPCVF